MRKTRTSYSEEFKIKAVELSIERGSIIIAADELGISKDTLRNWKRSHTLGKSNSKSSVSVLKSEEQEELKRLRKELYDVRLERDILKKAVSIFSKNDR